MVYWLVLFFLLLLIGLNRQIIRYGGGKSSTIEGRKVYIAIATVILVLITGLRGIQVGMDTRMYNTLFQFMQGMSSFSQAMNSWQSGHVEIGYALSEYLFAKYSNFQTFLFVMGMLSIIPVMMMIYRDSKNFWMSIFLYIAFGYFSFTMNAIRQSVAMGFCIIAYIYAKKKKIIPYFAFVILAMAFHQSAIIFLPVYWLPKIRFTKKTLLVYFILLLIANLFKSQFFSIVNLWGRQTYAVTEDAGGVRMYFFMLISIAIVYLFRNDFIAAAPEENTTLLTMLAVATLIWPIASANAAIFRLYYYYHIFIVFCIPAFLYHLKNRKLKYLFTAFFLLVGIYCLQVYVIGGNLKYDPIIFFWQQG